MVIRSTVPCNGCRACCQGELLILHPELGDVPASYLHEAVAHPLTGKPALALQHKPNGDCIYLGETGCTIHHRAPAICREFDCRKFFLGLGDRAARRRLLKQGMVTKDVVEAGRSRLASLDPAP
jgi:hypothetical protein